MKTKYGNAKIGNMGYYVITSYKEGNHRKLLHRLIWEDFWKTEVPKGYDIHHKNEDRTAGRLVECKKCPCDKFELGG